MTEETGIFSTGLILLFLKYTNFAKNRKLKSINKQKSAISSVLGAMKIPSLSYGLLTPNNQLFTRSFWTEMSLWNIEVLDPK